MDPAALVTGASSRIGRATALRLEGAGWSVFAGVRDPAGDALLGATGGRGTLEPVLLDVTDQESIAATRTRIAERVGTQGLRGLVNNAGIGVGGVLEFVRLEDLRQILEVNLTGQVAVTQAMLPLLRSGTGRIVFTSSDNGRWAPPYMSPYAASKFALEAVGDALRVELCRSKISVSIIEPGSIRTSIWDKGLDGIDDLNLPGGVGSALRRRSGRPPQGAGARQAQWDAGRARSRRDPPRPDRSPAEDPLPSRTRRSGDDRASGDSSRPCLRFRCESSHAAAREGLAAEAGSERGFGGLTPPPA
jgi:NAD(P)-dependent dehydrogenase (short-subunit alcohol dehydrogenase family)